MLTNSLWHCHRVLPLEDHTILGDCFLAVEPKEKCIVILFPCWIDSKSRIRIAAISAWYEEVSENEVRFSLITRAVSRWQEALYREENDFLQWVEPRGGKTFNMFCSKLPWDFLSKEYLEQYERAIMRANRIKLMRNQP